MNLPIQCLVRSAVAGMLLLLTVPGDAATERTIDYNRDIKPILSDNCYACHGPDAQRREADFRLDIEQDAKADLGGYVAISPGDPDRSVLLELITTDDEDDRMPPPDSNKSLTQAEIERIRLWIGQGAPWAQHWAFVAPTQPNMPTTTDGDWPQDPIDGFILKRLEDEGLAPSRQADKETLIRRVTFDLTGLPPTLDAIDAFLADDDPGAYERVVDGLLRNHRYGEHMARFWLDAARYGDTHGLHLDNYREMWPYRDWVIRAFNENMPFDRFVIEQLAGDLLPEPTDDQLVATGFNRCHVTTNEGGSIKEEVYVRNVVDRVVTTGSVFMGMTFECTRCHDHKFDPFTMKDFYSMFAYFNSIDGDPMDGNRKDHAPIIRLSTDEQKQRLTDYDTAIKQLDNQLNGPWEHLDEQQAIWEQELSAAQALAETDPEKATLELGDWYTVGPFDDVRRYLVRRNHGPEGKPVDLGEEFKTVDETTIRWVRRPDWKDGTIHADLPGDSAANFLYRVITSPSDRTVTVSLGSDDGIKVYLNQEELLSKDVSRGVAADQEMVELNLKEGENHLLLKIMNFGGAAGFYFALGSARSTVPDAIIEIVRVRSPERSEEQQRKLMEFYRNKISTDNELQSTQKEIKSLREARADVDRQIPVSLIYRERKDPKPAYFLNRGEYDQRGEQVSRRTPLSLPAMADDLSNDRLGLAQWLVDPAHPLTARVAVNRFWQQIFGVGIVKTAEDFGSQGEPPSHPELLDWLAVEFRDRGWNLKALMKQMVLSATYRQSSAVTPEVLERDPDNRLYARGPRFRLDAEMLRDQALSVSGLLVEEEGGPSVKPPQPDGLWFAVGYSGSNTVKFEADKEPDKVHRRTLYTFIKRTAPPPQMSTFDVPSREACSLRRERTNTPLQALLLFNDPQYVEAARALADRAMNYGGNDDASIARFMFRLCAGRHPSLQELDELVAGYGEDLEHYRNNLDAATQLIGIGGLSAALEKTELAAWTLTAGMLLNLDEVINKN